MKIVKLLLIVLFSFTFINTIYADTNGDYKTLSDFKIDDSDITCTEVLGPIMSKVVKSTITIVQVVCAIIALVNGMLVLLPAVLAKDADALKKASKTLVSLSVVLALVIIFKPIVRIIGTLFEYDVSCII